jgi:hypothetical protein
VEILGIDIGFGFTKATNGNDSLVFKSVFGEATDVQFRELVLAEGGQVDHLQLDVDGKSYFLGELAERQSNVRFFTLDQGQFVAKLITGGGGAVLAKYLDPLLKGHVMPVDAAKDARLNNVFGYRKFGKHLWARGVVPAPAGNQVP